MSVETVREATMPQFARGDVVVCIPVYNAAEHFARCLTSVCRHADADEALTVLVADDASPDPAIEQIVLDVAAECEQVRVLYLRRPENLGFVGNLNRVFVAADPADVVILNSDCVVAEGWLEGLRRAAYSDSRIATVTTLTNHGTIVSFPHRNEPRAGIPQDWSLDQLAGAIRASGTQHYPVIPTAIGHCVYIRRSALDLAGGFDDAFAPGYEEEVDFSQRCVVRGLTHVVADDVFVLHEGGGSFKASAAALMDRHHEIIKARYPYFEAWVDDLAGDDESALSRSLMGARRALGELTVTVDGRILGPFVTGTQIHALEVIAALATFTEVRVRVVVSPDLGDYAKRLLDQLPGVELLALGSVAPGVHVSDVFHRPFQVSSPRDLDIARILGRRLVVTHQDLIAYHNPGYFDDYEAWEDYRRLTRNALGAAHRVVFFSYHAARDARREQLVDDAQSRVVYIGTDHRAAGPQVAATPPRGSEGLDDVDFLLCLGTDFRHKNRVFAMRLLRALRDRHGWEGELVLAGAHVAGGSSSAEEALTLSRGQLEDKVRTLPAVNESEKQWLLDRGSGVVYPTVAEGFGLVPFEAADHGLPCFFAGGTSLTEVLPSSAATLVPWDPDASADAVIGLLRDDAERTAHVRAIRAAGARFTWRKTAQTLAKVYDEAAAAPTRHLYAIAMDQIEVEGRLETTREQLEHAQWHFDRVEAAMPELHGELSELRSREELLGEGTMRALTAIAYNPVLRRVILGPIRLLYRMMHGRRNES